MMFIDQISCQAAAVGGAGPRVERAVLAPPLVERRVELGEAAAAELSCRCSGCSLFWRRALRELALSALMRSLALPMVSLRLADLPGDVRFALGEVGVASLEAEAGCSSGT